MTTETKGRYRPSRTDSRRIEYGTIERATRDGIYISEMCDIANALEARIEKLEAALRLCVPLIDDFVTTALAREAIASARRALEP